MNHHIFSFLDFHASAKIKATNECAHLRAAFQADEKSAQGDFRLRQ
jgi:hypothetical protein